jgi:glucoamylase
MSHGKILRLIITAEAAIVWSADNWISTNKMETNPVSELNVWFADLPTKDCRDGCVIEFTFLWKDGQRWEGKNYSVAVSERAAAEK